MASALDTELISVGSSPSHGNRVVLETKGTFTSPYLPPLGCISDLNKFKAGGPFRWTTISAGNNNYFSSLEGHVSPFGSHGICASNPSDQLR